MKLRLHVQKSPQMLNNCQRSLFEVAYILYFELGPEYRMIILALTPKQDFIVSGLEILKIKQPKS